MTDTNTIADRLRATRDAVSRAARDMGREPGEVTLVAVSKTIAAEGITEALEAGQRVFGENYVQESAGKWPALRERFPDAEVHLVGPLQSNKAKEAVRLFDAIHSLDRVSLAAALAKEVQKAGRQPRLLVQVNTGDEPQKGGIAPDELAPFLARCRSEFDLAVEGLMCIPPVDDMPSPHFALLKRLATEEKLALLSMGMSADYPEAIQLGATHVRIGTAIFGARVPKVPAA